MLSQFLAHTDVLLALIVQYVFAPIRDIIDAAIPLVRSLHVTLAPALWGLMAGIWERRVVKRYPDPPKHPDDWDNASYGYLPTCKYVWDNWQRLSKKNDALPHPLDYEGILGDAIAEYKDSPDRRGKIPPSAENLRDSLQKNCGLTEEILKQWPSPNTVRGIYWRRAIVRVGGFAVAATVIAVVSLVFALGYRS